MRSLPRLFAFATTLLLVACGGGTTSPVTDAALDTGESATQDTPSTDSAAPLDTGVALDTAPSDTGVALDTAPLDTAPSDTGSALDTAPSDTGSALDTSPSDTSPPDTGGAADSGLTDTGAPADTTPPCAAGETRCDGRCVRTDSDREHCGACGTRCCAGSLCAAGSCVISCAPPGIPCGPPMGPDGCSNGRRCTLLASDAAHCGACGRACSAGQVCEDGVCLARCATTETRCGEACVDTSASADHCGACGSVCCGRCMAGRCTLECPAGQSPCGLLPGPSGCGTGATCADLQTSTVHCGACGRACAAGQVCERGECRVPCPTGQTRCGEVCTDTSRDRTNCGACGTACGDGQQCASGACRLPRSCDDLLALAPGTPSGAYTLDADGDGPVAPFRVYCDMVTDGGGWTLIASSSGGTNMPRFDTAASSACESASPTAPCFVGAAQLRALGLVEYRWSTAPTATDTRAPLENFRAGAPDVSATCVNATEYFRTNQDIPGQGMAWSGCDVSEVYQSTATCQTMYRPVWNLQRCEGVPISPGPRSSPDYNCSPFGQNLAGGSCAEFHQVRHWRRGRTCPSGQTYCDGVCADLQRDPRHCGACGRACDRQVCLSGVCTTVQSCADLLGRAPGTPSGRYPIDPDQDGSGAPVVVWCDMTTAGGGWTLVASSVEGTNMPRFTEAARPCNAPTPNAPCTLGAEAIRAMPFTEFAWSTTPTATHSRAPIDGHTLGVAAESAICINAAEYFRTNQDIPGQGMGWTGCTPTEAYMGEGGCNAMFRPVWNLLTCAGLPASPGPRSSPDYNCSPFGQNLPFGGTCAGFHNVRHWRR